MKKILWFLLAVSLPVFGVTFTGTETPTEHINKLNQIGGATGGTIEVQDESVSLTTNVTKFDFQGAGVTVTEPTADEVTVTIDGGGGSIEVQDEGSSLTAGVTKFNFVGTGVTVTEPAADEVQVTIASGGAPVDSVNSQTGIVVLDADDLSDTSTTNKFTNAAGLAVIAATTGTNTGDPQTLSNGVSDVTATATEVNLLDLSGLTAGHVLSADTATTASWKAQAGGGTGGEPVIIAASAPGTCTFDAADAQQYWNSATGDTYICTATNTWTVGQAPYSLANLSDVVSAAYTNRFALMANGTTGYIGRALVEADISDLTHTTDTNAATACTGTNVLEGSGACVANGSGGGTTTFTESFIIETATASDDLRVKAPAAITLTSLDCVATGATTPAAQIMTVMECTNAGATCVSTGGTITAAALTTNYNDSTFSDAAIDSGDWWGIDVTSLTTAADLIHCTVAYTR